MCFRDDEHNIAGYAYRLKNMVDDILGYVRTYFSCERSNGYVSDPSQKYILLLGGGGAAGGPPSEILNNLDELPLYGLVKCATTIYAPLSPSFLLLIIKFYSRS